MAYRKDSSGKKRFKITWGLPEGETWKHYLFESTKEDHDEALENAKQVVEELPVRIRKSRYYNAFAWRLILIVGVFVLIAVLSQKGLDDKRKEIKRLEQLVAAGEQLQEENAKSKKYYSDNDFVNARQRASEFCDILNAVHSGFQQPDDHMHAYLSTDIGHGSALYYDWAHDYDKTYTWSWSIDEASIDPDVITLIFELNPDDTVKPVMYEFCQYSYSEDMLVTRGELRRRD